MLEKKVIVAPMVRISTLPFRLLCLDYGADFVYSEEIIDFKMLRSVKEENNALGTTDFVDKTDGTVFFRTIPREKEHLIFQIGTSDAKRALKVAKMVEPHVFGVDVNMGCPKEFSIKGGMGAALLTQPDKIKSILTTLVQNLKVNVSCKIRILASLQETIDLCKMIESCGVSHIAIHGRTRLERPNDSNHNDVIKRISQELSIPVVANGGSKEIQSYEDIERFRQATGSSSVMVARAAMWNCSIVRSRGPIALQDVELLFRHYSIDASSIPIGYSASMQLLQGGLGNFKIWDLEEALENQKASLAAPQCQITSRSYTPSSIQDMRIERETDDCGLEHIKMPLRFIRGNYNCAQMPKMLVNTVAHEKGYSKPHYVSHNDDKAFTATLQIDGKKFTSTIREKNRRYAEQGAALVFLHSQELVDQSYGLIPLEGTRKHSSNHKLQLENAGNEPPKKMPRIELT